MLHIKPVNGTTIDVFSGKGWENWSRFNYVIQKGRVFLRLIAGTPMKQEDFKQLLSQVKG